MAVHRQLNATSMKRERDSQTLLGVSKTLARITPSPLKDNGLSPVPN